MSGNTAKILTTVTLLCVSITRLSSQEPNRLGPQGNVTVIELFSPVYPRLALQTRIAGDVQLSVLVRPDGSVESATVESGHPLLRQAALTSAEHSQFACENCGDKAVLFQLLYSFQLGPTAYCTKEKSYPRVTQSENHVTVLDQVVGTCDPTVQVRKVRSIKCLYLWRCGVHELTIGE
jgi:TonB family protein